MKTIILNCYVGYPFVAMRRRLQWFIHLRALILFKILALYKSLTFLLPYLLTFHR